jgi:hypothetical protein
LKNDLSE